MIKIILGDITEIDDVDVIVNSAKKSLTGGGGVDGAIHYKAGSDLLKACKELQGCNVGEAKITRGYNLPVPYIIHAVGPVHYSEEWAKEHNYDQAELLRSAYLNSLNLAKEHNLYNIAFSAISTGAYMYPIDEATKIALDTVIEFVRSNPEIEVTFVLYTEELYEEYIHQIDSYNDISYCTEVRNIQYEAIPSFNDVKSHYKDSINIEIEENIEPTSESNENIVLKIIKKIIKK